MLFPGFKGRMRILQSSPILHHTFFVHRTVMHNIPPLTSRMQVRLMWDDVDNFKVSTFISFVDSS